MIGRPRVPPRTLETGVRPAQLENGQHRRIGSRDAVQSERSGTPRSTNAGDGSSVPEANVMANILITPPDDTTRQPAAGTQIQPSNDAPHLNDETDGPMWSSLVSNLRDLFHPDRSAPLTLDSKPAENDLIIEEEGVFHSLWGSIRDVFFPKKLPPLVLESKPI